MKKFLGFIVLFAFASVNFTSCNYFAEKKAREQFVRDSIQHAQDSIRIAEERAKFVADSLENVRLDSLSLIAWGQAKFGMSLKEILATETFANSKKPEYYYGKITYYDKDYVWMKRDDIDAYNKSFNLRTKLKRIDARLKDGELYRVILESNFEDWDHLSNVIADCNYFVRQFSQKYVEPTKLLDGSQISVSDFKKGDEFVYAVFRIKNKSIYIQMGEDSYLRKPFYRIYISNSDFPKTKHVDTPEEVKEKQKAKEQEEFSKNNAF